MCGLLANHHFRPLQNIPLKLKISVWPSRELRLRVSGPAPRRHGDAGRGWDLRSCVRSQGAAALRALPGFGDRFVQLSGAGVSFSALLPTTWSGFIFSQQAHHKEPRKSPSCLRRDKANWTILKYSQSISIIKASSAGERLYHRLISALRKGNYQLQFPAAFQSHLSGEKRQKYRTGTHWEKPPPGRRTINSPRHLEPGRCLLPTLLPHPQGSRAPTAGSGKEHKHRVYVRSSS